MADPVLEYYGLSSFGIEWRGMQILVDPWFTEPSWETPSLDAFDDVDYILVTHGAYDHLGDTFPIAKRSGAHVFTEPAVADHLLDEGLPEEQVTRVIWGNPFDVGGVACRALETRHLSYFESGDRRLSGMPLGFHLDFDGFGVYYLGDTSIFSDLELFADLYDPDVALVPIGAAPGARAPLPPREAAVVTEWLDVETVVPVHYVPGSDEVEAFRSHLDDADGTTELARLTPFDRRALGE
ncbi:MBL fold metallo-hydrolase [Halogranum rubrum]|uniref:Metallo-beta-lactamase domain-containing protein n=1 Tax=Halogranum salarium B-1 TaxID=1210908 RepID=J3JHA3_9EURY|nr:MBL fold metallo-hydrolase [Halogranum salarium]EJN60811.1 hypothetical protein HSB1_14140 [Halogranum salarium B-1]